jgi:hypothetical protein
MRKKRIIKTDWARVDALADEEIDTSDIPPITEESFRNSKWWKPVSRRSAIDALSNSFGGNFKGNCMNKL